MSKAADGLSATVEVVRRRVPEDELSFSYSRSRGPGGQNVNKVNTRTTLWFDVEGTPSLSKRQQLSKATCYRLSVEQARKLVGLRPSQQRFRSLRYL